VSTWSSDPPIRARPQAVRAIGLRSERAWLDVALFRCPSCGRLYAEASWYAVELGCEIECSSCGTSFNPREELLDRIMLEFEVQDGRAVSVSIVKHLFEREKEA